MKCIKCNKETNDPASYCKECRELGYKEVERIKKCCKDLFDDSYKPFLRSDLVWH